MVDLAAVVPDAVNSTLLCRALAEGAAAAGGAAGTALSETVVGALPAALLVWKAWILCKVSETMIDCRASAECASTEMPGTDSGGK